MLHDLESPTSCRYSIILLIGIPQKKIPNFWEPSIHGNLQVTFFVLLDHGPKFIARLRPIHGMRLTTRPWDP